MSGRFVETPGPPLPFLVSSADATLGSVVRLTRFLRNPKTIVAEVALLALLFVVSTIVPAAGDEGSSASVVEGAAGLGEGLVGVLGLNHLFTSPLFLVLVALAMASLVVVLGNQVARAWRLSRGSSGPAGPSGAPYRREVVFRGEKPAGDFPTGVRIRGAAGVWGSPLFHLGILLIAVAGILRTLFGADAVVDLLVGETLRPEGPYARQWPGLLAGPFAFPIPVRLEELHVTRYPSGETRWVEGTLRLGEGPGSAIVPIAVNGPVTKDFHTLYLRTTGGAAALVDVRHGSGSERHAILLRETGRGGEGTVRLGDGTLLRAASGAGGIGRIPERVDLRALRQGALAGVAQLGRNEALTLPDGTRLAVAEILPWAQFSARRDVATPVVYMGFFFACVGGLLMMAVVRVESGAAAETVDGGVKLTVWMKPQRFAPLFTQAFEDFWNERVAAFEAARKDDSVGRE